MAFTAADVKTLRERTNVGMMDCKKALTECDGDMEKAIEMLSRSRYDEIVGLIDREEFAADPIGAYENRIYCKSAPMKTAVIWNKAFIDTER